MSAQSSQKVWFITGISRGLGHAIARAALAAGDIVIGTTRDGMSDIADPEGRLHIVAMDLADLGQIVQAVDAAFGVAGRLDVIVNNAGYPLFGAVEEANDAQVVRLVDVNVHGPRRVIQAALPRLRAQGHGHIVNITSVGAYVTLSGYGYYAACKAATESLTEVLASEVSQFGLRVTAVAPGAFRTDLVSHKSVDDANAAGDLYPDTRRNVARFWETAGKQIGDPDRLAQALVELVAMREPPTRLLLGSDAVTRVSTHANALLRDIAANEAVSKSTDFTQP